MCMGMVGEKTKEDCKGLEKKRQMTQEEGTAGVSKGRGGAQEGEKNQTTYSLHPHTRTQTTGDKDDIRGKRSSS